MSGRQSFLGISLPAYPVDLLCHPVSRDELRKYHLPMLYILADLRTLIPSLLSQ